MEICGRVFKERETPDSRASGWAVVVVVVVVVVYCGNLNRPLRPPYSFLSCLSFFFFFLGSFSFLFLPHSGFCLYVQH